MRPRLPLRLGLGLCLLLSSTACFDDPPYVAEDGDGDGDPGDGDPGDGDPGDGDPGDGDPGDEMCADGDSCVDGALSGWEGPMLVYTGGAGETPPACQGGVPVKVAELFSDLAADEPPGTCGCECSPITDVTCAPVTLRQSNQQACLTTADMWDLVPENCTDLGGVQGGSYYAANEPNMVDATCNPSYVEELQPAAHGTQVLACAVADDAQSCGQSGVCIPPADTPFDGRVCVATDGDVQCPNGAYSDRSVYYTGLDDSRSCVDCACGAPPNATCSGSVVLTGSGCGPMGFLLSMVDTGSCSASINNVEFASFNPAPPMAQGSCMASGGGVDGAVEELGAMTFCCQ